MAGLMLTIHLFFYQKSGSVICL